MKLRYLTLLAIISAFGAQAEVLTPAEALGRAAANLPQTVAPGRRAAALRNAEPLLTIGAEKPEVYLFGSAAGGLVVASAESETHAALLGYSETYSEGAELPPSLKWLVGYYGQEIRALRNGDVVKRPLRRASQSDFAPIDPICKTEWSQATPYCYDCPPDGDYYSVTGCVATAMAQVLKTYEYPARCSGGTFSYQWQNGNKTLSKNFDNVTLDWANMLDTYPSRPSISAATSQAVATLMSAVGYASRMNYSANGSGTQGIYCAEGMIRNFGYDYTLQFLYKDWFDLATWQRMVYDEIAAGHPLYYDGANLEENTGHAFVIDGYDADGYFHVNWGWGGHLDGYFLLTALNPDGEQGIGGSSGGYSEQAAAIFNMSPGKTMTAAEAPLTIYSNKPLLVPASKKLGGMISDEVGVYNFSPFVVSDVMLALRFTNNSGDNYYTDFVSGLPDLDICVGTTGTASYSIPANLPEGQYTVSRVAYNPTSGEYFDMYYYTGVTSRISAMVSGTTVTFSDYVEPTEESMYFSDVTFPSVIYFDEEFSISSNFCNATQSDYTGRIYLNFYRKGTSEVAYRMSSGEFTLGSMSYVAFNPTATIAQGKMEPGEYTIGLACDAESVVSETKDVTVRMRPAVIQGSKFECTSQHVNNIWFNIDLTALNSDYSGTVALVIAKNKTSPILWSDKFTLNLAAGETTTKSYSEIDLTDKANVGEKYIIYGLYVDEKGVSTNLDGEWKLSITLTDELTGLKGVVAAPAKAEYFDLTGRRVENPSAGVYIRREGSNTQTIHIR